MSRPSRFPLLAVAGILVMLVGIVPASAQVQAPAMPVGLLTLEQVLELAEERSETIALADAGVRRAEGEQTRARSSLYPQLSASASYDRSLASEFEGIFDTQEFTGGSGDDAGGDEGGFEDLPFGRANTRRISLALTQAH
jgi:outer membrane protein TolC